MIKSIFLFFLGLFIGISANSAEYLVKYRSTISMNFMWAESAFQVRDIHSAGNLMKVEIPDNHLLDGLIALDSNPNVEYVVPNSKIYSFSVVRTSAPILQRQWALDTIQAQEAWQRAGNKGSKNITVAVIDTGVDYHHESLSPNIAVGWDFLKDNNDPMDIVSNDNPGHGTHCSGIIGATGLLQSGTQGISPQVSILPLRVIDESGTGDLDIAIKAIDYAIEHKVQVISASWGAAISRDNARPIIEAIKRADAVGITFVVAASNDGKNNDSYEVYPAKAGTKNLISVAASDEGDGKPSWSNYGRTSVSLAAPGNAILSTLPGNHYGLLSGTSMATPLVAGLVAFLEAQDNSLKPDEIRSLLQSTGEHASIATACDCRINALFAVDSLLNKKMFVHPYATTVVPGGEQKFTAVYGKPPFTFQVSNASVASIDQNGNLKALTAGFTNVTITDARGVSATSYKIYVAAPGTSPDPGPPVDTGLPSRCPADAIGCQQVCEVIPTLPWCK